MSAPEQIIRHVLPTDDDADQADTAWFRRQNAFERDELSHLVAYKRDVLNVLEDGVYSKRPNYTYPHILPQAHLRQSFFEPLADEILAYLEGGGIQQHTELLNLKSSQAACLNLLFPLHRDPQLAFNVLHPFLDGLQAVTGIEFEHTAQDESKGGDGCTRWLGEPPGGKRGQNRTSIDAAILWTDKRNRRCATLVEWKYTERSFGVCSAFEKAKGEDSERCLGNAFTSECLLTTGGPYRSRNYWSRLADAGIDLSRLDGISGCPFRGPFYQLMRQFLIARYMLEADLADFTEVVAVHFRRNDALRAVPPHLRALAQPGVLDAWNSSLSGVPPMRSIEAEQLLAAYDVAPAWNAEWRDFIRTRYRI